MLTLIKKLEQKMEDVIVAFFAQILISAIALALLFYTPLGKKYSIQLKIVAFVSAFKAIVIFLTEFF
jgi:sterol desaturase/sphingolipid hydroxylase (fatty acid hydroxylase superfamily)